jgi:hypothetical protein
MISVLGSTPLMAAESFAAGQGVLEEGSREEEH